MYPELRLNLTVEQEAGFKLYVQVYVYGKVAESLAETLEVGMWVMVDGKLGWRTSTKDGAKESRMVVTSYAVEILTPPAEPVATRSHDAEGDFTSDAPANAPEPPGKVRKRPYPKLAREGGFSQN